ncbi:nuclear transport factor 2 family protein [Hymenobacter perfusus]|uniref:SnoaL-like domain-containing protein n=1 Tax=Hymenobacter perfusus TaxID=1236770 RepID=A0A3R9MRG8_9BACT|nr:nuclear transport factor 2 family protein [Hymenobacter perfusus]RSK38918.1 hypothetical protein EI293_20575 [Hymenobacter perfusus]
MQRLLHESLFNSNNAAEMQNTEMETNFLDPALEFAMRDSLEAYAEGDQRFFDYLHEKVQIHSNDARLFALKETEAIDGRETFREKFTQFETKRSVNEVSLNVQMIAANKVLAARNLSVEVNGIESSVRQTIIWDKGADGKWQMSHIHSALVGQPVLTGANAQALSMEEIRVLNERIATVAATVGVAQ